MKPTLRATPLQKLRHQKGWRLIRVQRELQKQGTPISWPTLINIDRGFKVVVIRDENKQILEERKLPYKPGKRLLTDIADLFDVPVKKIYQDRSQS